MEKEEEIDRIKWKRKRKEIERECLRKWTEKRKSEKEMNKKGKEEKSKKWKRKRKLTKQYEKKEKKEQ